MGGIDWTGLPYAVAHVGFAEVPLLIEQLLVIKTHKPPQAAGPHSPLPRGLDDSTL